MRLHRSLETGTLAVLMVAAALAAPAATAQDEGSTPAVQETFDRSVVVLTDMGNGAGVSLGDGKVLTAEHVVQDAGSVWVHDGDRGLPASVMRADAKRDLALLSVPGLGLDAVPFRESPVSVGERVFAIGAPLTDYLQVSAGIASALVKQGGVERIQTDAPVNPGNSGGPLVDENGALLGVVVLKRTDNEGIGFATAISEVEQFLARGEAGPPAETRAPTPEATGPPADPSAPEPLNLPVWLIVAGVLVTAIVLLAAAVRRRRTRRPAPVRLPPLDLTHENLSAPPEEVPWKR